MTNRGTHVKLMQELSSYSRINERDWNFKGKQASVREPSKEAGNVGKSLAAYSQTSDVIGERIKEWS